MSPEVEEMAEPEPPGGAAAAPLPPTLPLPPWPPLPPLLFGAAVSDVAGAADVGFAGATGPPIARV